VGAARTTSGDYHGYHWLFHIGSIKTLTLNIKAKFAPSDKENDKAPDYRIFAGATEFGAAWK
jgi:uncharacterized protein (DUF736 family)